MGRFTEISPDIYRLTTPYKDIYTTVLLIRTTEGLVLFDTASYPEDVENYILPALKELQVTTDALKYVFISHPHTDHAGGLGRLLTEFPSITVVSRSQALQNNFPDRNFLKPEDGDIILDSLQVVTIPGHTSDSSALLDNRTGTLLTGDCLQLFGIFGSGKWGANIGLPAEHLKALEKLHTLPINTIIASHDYHPCGYMATGAENVNNFINACADALSLIKETIDANPGLDDAAIADIYNNTQQLPTVGAHVVAALKAMH